MSKDKKLVPKLRFPEFLDQGGWSLKKLGDYLTESRLPGSKGDVAKKITVKLWGNGVVEKNEAVQGSVNTQYFQRKAGQFIYSKLDFLNQAFGIIPEQLDNFESTVDLPCFDFAGELASEFLLEYVSRKDFYEKVGETADGSRKAKRIHAETFLSFRVALPSAVEQKRISDCLGSLDDLITAQARKVKALEVHKNGLMQQLFPCKGETQPRLRFPEFQNAGAWEMKSLGSFCKVGDIDHKMPSSTAEGIPYIMTGDFFGINGIDYENAKKISAEDYERLSRKIKPEFGDNVIARYASVGAVRYIETKSKFLVSYSCAIIKSDKSEDSKYIYYALQSDAVQSQIGLEVNASSQKNIGIDAIKKLCIFLPKPPEQQKICACLANFDNQIHTAARELETLKAHKKGLMQQLFPSAEALEA